jgi:hypothetical protein
MTARVGGIGQGLRLAAVAVLSAVMVAATVIGAGLRLLPYAPQAPPLSPALGTESANLPQHAQDAGLRPWRPGANRPDPARP